MYPSILYAVITGQRKDITAPHSDVNSKNRLHEKVEKRSVLLFSTIHFGLAWYHHVLEEGGAKR
jgi:hypothetical protein